MGLISRVSSRTYRDQDNINKNMAGYVACEDRTFRGMSVYEDEGKNFYAEGPDRAFDFSLVQNAQRGGSYTDAVGNGVQQLNQGLPLDLQQRHQAAEQIVNCMLLFKQNEITQFVSQKSMPELDMLMKLVYKGFEIHSNISTCARLINWHSAIESKSGIGSIMRAMS